MVNKRVWCHCGKMFNKKPLNTICLPMLYVQLETKRTPDLDQLVSRRIQCFEVPATVGFSRSLSLAVSLPPSFGS